MRPRTVGKIAVVVFLVGCLLASLIFAIIADEETIYKSYRAITYAIMGLTFAVLYRYFED